MSMNLPIYILGKFYAVESNMGLTVQMRYGQCFRIQNDENQPSCVIGVFVQYKKEMISVQFSDSMYSKDMIVRNNTAQDHLKLTMSGASYVISVRDSPVDKYDDLSSSLTIITYDNPMSSTVNGKATSYQMNFISVETRLSPIHYQQTQGHCGVYDLSPEVRDPTNHLLINGDFVQKVSFYDNMDNSVNVLAWAKMFTVDASEDGFTTITPINFSRFDKSSAKHQNKRSISKRAVVGAEIPAIQIKPTTPTKLQMTTEAAKKLCLECFAFKNEVLDSLSRDALMSCIADVSLSGSNSFCTSHSLIATQSLLRLAANPNITHLEEKAGVLKVTNEGVALLGLKAHMLKADCGNDVNKTIKNLCHCKSGTSGPDCSHKIRKISVGN